MKIKYYLILFPIIFLSACSWNNQDIENNTNLEQNNTINCEDDNCYFNLATKDKNLEICKQIKNNNLKINCENTIQVNNYIQNKDLKSCYGLSNLDLRRKCELSVLEQLSKDDCVNLKILELKNICLDYFTLKEAKTINDCKLIKDIASKKECESMFIDTSNEYYSLDLDSDGLTNAEEKEYGTNPKKADTDGDGISDGDEIKNNTDPLTKN